MCEAVLGLVFLIQFGSERFHLAVPEVGDLEGPPTLGGADHGAEHQLEHGPLAEGVGDDLQAPAFLDEQALEQIGRAGRAAVGDRQAQVGDAGLEVALEAGPALGSWAS